MQRYVAYGIPLRSNLPIPALSEVSAKDEDDCMQVVMGRLPAWLVKSSIIEGQEWHISDYLDEQSQPHLRVWLVSQGSYLYFRYTDGTEFVVSREGTEIWATWPDNLTLDDTLTYVLGPIFGVILRLRGLVCLHASAVLIGDRVAVLVGDSGAGKSTTAAAFAQMGCPVLSDDVVGLLEHKDTFSILPAYPRIRLWKESVTALYGRPDALPPVVPTNPTWDKQYLDLNQPGYHFQSTPLPLGAIYFLNNRSSEPDAPWIEAVGTKQSQLMHLLRNTYASRFIDKMARAHEFEQLSRLVKQVPIRKITPHKDIARLPQLLDTVLKDFHKIDFNP